MWFIFRGVKEVWTYQRGNQNGYIEGQIIQLSKQIWQTNNIQYTAQKKKSDTWTWLKPGGEIKWFGRVSSSCSTCNTLCCCVRVGHLFNCVVLLFVCAFWILCRAVRYDFCINPIFGSSLLFISRCLYEAYCVCLRHRGVQHILCCVFVCFLWIFYFWLPLWYSLTFIRYLHVYK